MYKSNKREAKSQKGKNELKNASSQKLSSAGEEGWEELSLESLERIDGCWGSTAGGSSGSYYGSVSSSIKKYSRKGQGTTTTETKNPFYNDGVSDYLL